MTHQTVSVSKNSIMLLTSVFFVRPIGLSIAVFARDVCVSTDIYLVMQHQLTYYKLHICCSNIWYIAATHSKFHDEHRNIH